MIINLSAIKPPYPQLILIFYPNGTALEVFTRIFHLGMAIDYNISYAAFVRNISLAWSIDQPDVYYRSFVIKNS